MLGVKEMLHTTAPFCPVPERVHTHREVRRDTAKRTAKQRQGLERSCNISDVGQGAVNPAAGQEWACTGRNYKRTPMRCSVARSLGSRFAEPHGRDPKICARDGKPHPTGPKSWDWNTSYLPVSLGHLVPAVLWQLGRRLSAAVCLLPVRPGKRTTVTGIETKQQSNDMRCGVALRLFRMIWSCVALQHW